MRSQDGKHFENVVGIIDFDPITGKEFDANVFDCNKPMNARDTVMVRDKVFECHGEDNLGRSIFTRAGRPVTDALFIRK